MLAPLLISTVRGYSLVVRLSNIERLGMSLGHAPF